MSEVRNPVFVGVSAKRQGLGYMICHVCKLRAYGNLEDMTGLAVRHANSCSWHYYRAWIAWYSERQLKKPAAWWLS